MLARIFWRELLGGLSGPHMSLLCWRCQAPIHDVAGIFSVLPLLDRLCLLCHASTQRKVEDAFEPHSLPWTALTCGI